MYGTRFLRVFSCIWTTELPTHELPSHVLSTLMARHKHEHGNPYPNPNPALTYYEHEHDDVHPLGR